VAGQQVAQLLGSKLAAGQSSVGAAPAAPMCGLQAQVGNRWDRLGAQQRVGKLQQGVGAAGAAGVQLGAEGGQPRQGEASSAMTAQPDPPDGSKQPDQRKQPGRVKSQVVL
jgi:hypothetical protein